VEVRLHEVAGVEGEIAGHIGEEDTREATDQEILVRQRQLATSYRYGVSVGLSYTFGSIFNNVVNPRFEGASGGTFFF